MLGDQPAVQLCLGMCLGTCLGICLGTCSLGTAIDGFSCALMDIHTYQPFTETKYSHICNGLFHIH